MNIQVAMEASTSTSSSVHGIDSSRFIIVINIFELIRALIK